MEYIAPNVRIYEETVDPRLSLSMSIFWQNILKFGILYSILQ